jgi:hypothetical protein
VDEKESAKMIRKIIVTKQTINYCACLKKDPLVQGHGLTPDEAIGNLVASHGSTFGIEICNEFDTDNDCSTCNYWAERHPGCGLDGCKMGIVSRFLISLFGCPYVKYVKKTPQE